MPLALGTADADTIGTGWSVMGELGQEKDDEADVDEFFVPVGELIGDSTSDSRYR